MKSGGKYFYKDSLGNAECLHLGSIKLAVNDLRSSCKKENDNLNQKGTLSKLELILSNSVLETE